MSPATIGVIGGSASSSAVGTSTRGASSGEDVVSSAPVERVPAALLMNSGDDAPTVELEGCCCTKQGAPASIGARSTALAVVHMSRPLSLSAVVSTGAVSASVSTMTGVCVLAKRYRFQRGRMKKNEQAASSSISLQVRESFDQLTRFRSP